MMTTAEEWMQKFDKIPISTLGPEFFRQIQADALRHAANIAMRTPTCGGGNLRISTRLMDEAMYTERKQS